MLGLGWSFTGQLGRQVLQLLIAVILARLLGPEAYGLIGMITVFTGFLAVVRDLGLGAAVVQRQDVRPAHLDTVFWTNLVIGFLLMVLTVGAARPIAAFYNEPDLVPLVLALSITFLVGSVGILHRALVQKALDFKSLTLVDTAAMTLGGTGAVVVALLGYGAWSLVAQALIVTTASVAIMWKVNEWRPRLSFSWRALEELWGFSGSFVAFSVVNYWLRNGDNLLIGRFLGSEALGLYSRAYALMLLPLRNLSSSVGRVMFPAFSSIQNDQQRIGRVYLRVSAVVALLAFPAMLGLVATADRFVIFVLGDQWRGMIPILRLLAIVGMIQSVASLNGNLFLSQGRSDLQFKVGGIVGLLGIGAIMIGLSWGVVGVAAAYTVFTLVVLYPSVSIAVRLVNLRFLDVAKNLSGITLVSATMAVSVWGLGELVAGFDGWILVVQVLGGAMLYLVLLHSLKIAAYGEVRELAREIRARRARQGRDSLHDQTR